MEEKKITNYSQEEKKKLLLHWWCYFGNSRYSIVELSSFIKLLNEKPDDVMKIAISSFMCGVSNGPLLHAIKTNTVDKLVSSIPNVEEDEVVFGYCYKDQQADFIAELVKTYKSPKNVKKKIRCLPKIIKRKPE